MVLSCSDSSYKPQGGMSNEMYNTIARVTDGIYEGIYSSWVFYTVFCDLNAFIYDINQNKM